MEEVTLYDSYGDSLELKIEKDRIFISDNGRAVTFNKQEAWKLCQVLLAFLRDGDE